MESLLNEPAFTLLVPTDPQRLPDLHDRNDAVQEWLRREGAQLPMATIRAMQGVTVCYGVGHEPERNIRAETALTQMLGSPDTWGWPSGFQVHGPVIFTNVTAKQAFEIMRDSWEAAREGLELT